MIRVLHLIWRWDFGGIESFCISLMNNMNSKTISFDFVVCGDKIGENEQYIRELGCQVYHLPLIQGKQGKKQYLKELHNLLKKHKYDIVHSHLAFMNISTLFVAWRLGVSGRISHAHVKANDITTWKKKFKLILQQFLMRLNATNCFGCSEIVSRYYFGKLGGKVRILYSGIDIKKFLNYDVSNRIENHFIVVGRMCIEKNPFFIIEIMRELLLLNPQYTFTWCGDGELLDMISQRLSDIRSNVYLTGGVNNIPNYLWESSYMLMPSVKEGFGMATIEAQLADVFVFASDRVPKDTDLGLIEYLSLEKNAKEWANYINNFIIEGKRSLYHINSEKIHRFDMRLIAKEIMDIYQKVC